MFVIYHTVGLSLFIFGSAERRRNEIYVKYAWFTFYFCSTNDTEDS